VIYNSRKQQPGILRGFVHYKLGNLISMLALTALAALLWPGQAFSQGNRPPENEATLAEGKVIYFDRCVYCHGELGDGNGPAADFLDPRPRDLTMGMFKIRTTESGQLPRDIDLFNAVSRGLSGTAMPRWELTLSEDQRWKVVYFIKTFTPEFADPDFNPENFVVKASSPIPFSEDSAAKGREIFLKAKCWECHGKQGRGDGQKSDTLQDGWGFKLRVRNLTRGWSLKGGNRPEDIFYRFSTGVDGTPMPSFIKTLSEEERWHLANYISALASDKESEGVVIKAASMEGDLPENADDPAWDSAPVLKVPLTGQVLAQPRWQNISVDMVEARALYNGQDIAVLVVWDDPFKDTVHDESQEIKEFQTTYVKAFGDIPRKPNVFRDSVALQFPVKMRDGARKPHFFRGETSDPVNMWVWKSDLQEQGVNSAEEFNAKGFQKPLALQPGESQQVKGMGTWKDGQWRVVLTRSLKNEDSRNDVQFEPGRLIPIAFNVWDGSNGEHGLIMSLSDWRFIALEASIPGSLYLWTIVVMLMVGLAEWWFVRYSRNKRKEI